MSQTMFVAPCLYTYHVFYNSELKLTVTTFSPLILSMLRKLISFFGNRQLEHNIHVQLPKFVTTFIVQVIFMPHNDHSFVQVMISMIFIELMVMLTTFLPSCLFSDRWSTLNLVCELEFRTWTITTYNSIKLFLRWLRSLDDELPFVVEILVTWNGRAHSFKSKIVQYLWVNVVVHNFLSTRLYLEWNHFNSLQIGNQNMIHEPVIFALSLGGVHRLGRIHLMHNVGDHSFI